MEGEDRPLRVLDMEGRCTAGKETLAISDSGSGISEENRKKIFEPFFSTKGRKGYGLGLYISRHIVELHEGEIHVESEVGEGSTMSFSFPALTEEETL